MPGSAADVRGRMRALHAPLREPPGTFQVIHPFTSSIHVIHPSVRRGASMPDTCQHTAQISALPPFRPLTALEHRTSAYICHGTFPPAPPPSFIHPPNACPKFSLAEACWLHSSQAGCTTCVLRVCAVQERCIVVCACALLISSRSARGPPPSPLPRIVPPTPPSLLEH